MSENNVVEIKVEIRAIGNQYLSTVTQGVTNKLIITNIFTDNQSNFLLEEILHLFEQQGIKNAENDRSTNALKSVFNLKSNLLLNYGQQLFKWLFGAEKFGTPHHKLSNFLNTDNNYKMASHLRISLKFHSEVHSLLRHAWEYLHDGHNYLLQDRFTLNRSSYELADENKLKKQPYPLRILVLIGFSTGNHNINIEDELAVLQEALDGQEIIYHILEDSTLKTLKEELSNGRYHILHFIGHSDIDKKNQERFLILENQKGQSKQIYIKDFLHSLKKTPSLQLVVLTGNNPPLNAENTINGVALDLINGGIPAVLTLQHLVFPVSTVVLLKVFYGSLASLASLEQATRKARLALLQNQLTKVFEEKDAIPDWGVLSLFLSCFDEPIIDKIQQVPVKKVRKKNYELGTMPLPPHFSGRRQELRELRQLMVVSGTMNRVGFIQGYNGLGKSALVARFATLSSIERSKIFVVRCQELSTSGQLIMRLAAWFDSHGKTGHAEVAKLLSEGPQSPFEKGQLVANFIRQQRYLFIIDNLETLLETDDGALAQTATQILELLWGLCEGEGRSLILFTSKIHWEKLQDLKKSDSIKVINLAFLSLQETVYFINNLPKKSVLAERDYQDKIRLWNKMRGVPFTIKLLEACISVGQSLSNILDEQTPSQMEENWSQYFLNILLSNLDKAEQLALKQLSVFTGPFGPDIYTGVGVQAEIIKRWVDLSLLLKGEVIDRNWPTYSLHPLIFTSIIESLSIEERRNLHSGAAYFYQDNIHKLSVLEAMSSWNSLAEFGSLYKNRNPDDPTLVIESLRRHVNNAQNLEEFSRSIKLALEWRKQLIASGQVAKASAIVNEVLWKSLIQSGHHNLVKLLLEESVALDEGDGKILALEKLHFLEILDSEKDQQEIEKESRAITRPNLASLYFLKGTASLNQEQFEEALDAFSSALEFDPNYPEAYLHRGITYSRLGKISEAFQDYTRSIELNPLLPQAYFNRANLNEDLRRFEDALTDYTQAIRLESEVWFLYFQRGYLYDRLGRYKEALDDYGQCLKLKPDDFRTLNKRAKIYINLQQAKSALEDIEQVLALDPKNLEAYTNRGDFYFRTGAFDLAITDFSLALNIDPSYAVNYFNRGTTYLNMNRKEEALQDFRKAVELKPDYADAYYNLGVLLALEGNDEKAEEAFNNANKLGISQAGSALSEIKRHRENSQREAYNSMELAYQAFIRASSLVELKGLVDEYPFMADKDYLKVIEKIILENTPDEYQSYMLQKLELLLKLVENDSSILYELGNVFRETEQFDQALTYYNLVLEQDPLEIKALLNRGATYYDMGLFEDALVDFNRFIEFNPNEAIAYINRGATYNALGRSDLEMLDYTRAIELDTSNLQGYLNRAAAYTDNNLYDEALSDYTRIIETDPNNYYCFNKRGIVYSMLGQDEKAISDYNQAILLNPNYPDAYTSRGSAYGKLENYEQAFKDFGKAIELNPRDGMAFYNRGVLYVGLRQYRQALREFEKADQLGFPLAKNALIEIRQFVL